MQQFINYQSIDASIQEFEIMDEKAKNLLLHSMKEHIQLLQQQILDLEKSAIDLIIEKDQRISILEQDHLVKLPNDCQEIHQLQEHINGLSQRIEDIQQNHYKQIYLLEQKWNNYTLDQISKQNKENESEQKQLLEQVHLLEQRTMKLDCDIEYKENQLIAMQHKSNQLKHQVEQLNLRETELTTQIVKLQKEHDMKSQLHLRSIITLEEANSKLTIQNVQLNKQIQIQKTINLRLIQQNKDYYQSINELISKCHELEISTHQQLNYSSFMPTLSTDQGIEVINTSEYDVAESDNTFENIEYIKQLDQKQQQLTQYEQCIKQSNCLIKEQNAKLQLLNQQIKTLRLQQFNTKSIRQYIQCLESDFLQSKLSWRYDIDRLHQQHNLVIDENHDLKQQIRLIKTKNTKQRRTLL